MAGYFSVKIMIINIIIICGREIRMFDIEYENENFLLAYKKAGIAVQTARLGEKDLVSEVSNYLKTKGNNQPYVAVINRLDQPVEGIVLFAKNKKTAAMLSKQLQDGTIRKYYHAAVLGKMEYPKGTMVDFMIKDEKNNISRVVSDNTPSAKKAVLEYEAIESEKIDNTSLVTIHLVTGRHHQIRAQFSSAGHSLIGDRKYGGEEAARIAKEHGIRGICLCAYKMSLVDPASNEEIEIDAQARCSWINCF